MGDQPVGAGRQVVDAFERRSAHRRRIEHHDVGRQADGEAATIVEAEKGCGRSRQAVHRLFERERAVLADPMAQQVRRIAGVAELAEMRAAVAQADHDVGILDDLAHLVLDEVELRGPHAGVEILQRQVEHQVDGMLAALAGDIGELALLERRILGLGDDIGPEGSATRVALELLAHENIVVGPAPVGLPLHARAEGGIGIDGAARGIVGRLARRGERGPGVEHDRRMEVELDLDRPAGALRVERQAARDLLASLGELRAMRVGAERSREQRRPHQRPARLGVERLVLLPARIAADIVLDDAVARPADGIGDLQHLVETRQPARHRPAGISDMDLGHRGGEADGADVHRLGREPLHRRRSRQAGRRARSPPRPSPTAAAACGPASPRH